MTRGADRILRHFAANSLESARNGTDRPVRRQRPMSNAAVFVYRHPLSEWLGRGGQSDRPLLSSSASSLEADSDWSHSLLESATGNRLRPVGSIVRRSARPNRDANATQRRFKLYPSKAWNIPTTLKSRSAAGRVASTDLSPRRSVGAFRRMPNADQ